MQKTKYNSRYPPINDLRAAILERKFVAGLTWDDLGAVAGVKGTTMRKMARDKPPQEWSRKVLIAVCRLLDIRISVSVTGE